MQCDICGEEREELWYTLTQFGLPSRRPGQTSYCERCVPESTLTPDQRCLVCRQEPVDPVFTQRVRFAANHTVRLQLLCGAECREEADQRLHALMDEHGVHDANEQKDNSAQQQDDDQPITCSACDDNINTNTDAAFTTTLFALRTTSPTHNQPVSLTLCSHCQPSNPLPPTRYCAVCTTQPIDEQCRLEVKFVHLRMVVNKEVCSGECRAVMEREMVEQLGEDGLYRQEEWQAAQAGGGAAGEQSGGAEVPAVEEASEAGERHE